MSVFTRLFGTAPARAPARRPALALEALGDRVVPANFSPRPPAGFGLSLPAGLFGQPPTGLGQPVAAAVFGQPVPFGPPAAGFGRPAPAAVFGQTIPIIPFCQPPAGFGQPAQTVPRVFTARADRVVSVSDPGRRADVAGLSVTTDGGRIGFTVPGSGGYSAALSSVFVRSDVYVFSVTTTRTTTVPVPPTGAVVTITRSGGVEYRYPPLFGVPGGLIPLTTQTVTTTETVSGTLTVGPGGRPVGLTFAVDVTTRVAWPAGKIGGGPPPTTTHLAATVTLK